MGAHGTHRSRAGLRMNILVVSYFYEYGFGGAEIAAQTIKAIFERSLDARVSVLCLSGGAFPQRDPGIIRLPVPAWLVARPQFLKRTLLFLNNPVFDAALGARAVRALGGARWDLVHCQDFNALQVSYSLAKRAGTPLLLTLHDTLPRRLIPGALPAPLTRGIDWLLRRRAAALKEALAYSSAITGVSDFVCFGAKKFCERLGIVPPPRLRTIYNPIEPHLLQQRSIASRPPRQGPGARLLFLGRLSREKGIDILLKALPLLRDAPALTVVGLPGPLAARVARQADCAANIRLEAALPHHRIPEIIRDHDIVCCPSLFPEPFGKVVLEARALGRKIVTTRVGGIPELISGYRDAYTVDVEGKRDTELVTALAQAIAQAIAAPFLTDPSPAPRSAEAEFLRRFHPEAIAACYQELLGEVLCAAPHRRGGPAEDSSG